METRKTDGDSTSAHQMDGDTGDLREAVETTEKLLTLATMRDVLNSTHLNFLKENPDIIISELNRILEWISILPEWFVTLKEIESDDGTIMIRISIAPPNSHKLEIFEDKSSNSKTILMTKKPE